MSININNKGLIKESQKAHIRKEQKRTNTSNNIGQSRQLNIKTIWLKCVVGWLCVCVYKWQRLD